MINSKITSEGITAQVTTPDGTVHATYAAKGTPEHMIISEALSMQTVAMAAAVVIETVIAGEAPDASKEKQNHAHTCGAYHLVINHLNSLRHADGAPKHHDIARELVRVLAELQRKSEPCRQCDGSGELENPNISGHDYNTQCRQCDGKGVVNG